MPPLATAVIAYRSSAAAPAAMARLHWGRSQPRREPTTATAMTVTTISQAAPTTSPVRAAPPPPSVPLIPLVARYPSTDVGNPQPANVRSTQYGSAEVV